MFDVVADELESDLSTIQIGDSRVGRQFLYHDRESYHVKLCHDYFFDRPTYGPVKFRRRFRMQSEFFVRIVEVVAIHDLWFL